MTTPTIPGHVPGYSAHAYVNKAHEELDDLPGVIDATWYGNGTFEVWIRLDAEDTLTAILDDLNRDWSEEDRYPGPGPESGQLAHVVKMSVDQAYRILSDGKTADLFD